MMGLLSLCSRKHIRANDKNVVSIAWSIMSHQPGGIAFVDAGGVGVA
jgi:hypothetical protein